MIGTGRLNRAARIRDRICVLSPISASPTTSVDTRKASMSEVGPLSRGQRQDQIAGGVHHRALAGMDQRRGAHLFDNRRPRDPAPARQRGAVMDRRVAPAGRRIEIDRASRLWPRLAAFCRTHARKLRPSGRHNDFEPQRDDLDAAARNVIAIGGPVRGTETLAEVAVERICAIAIEREPIERDMDLKILPFVARLDAADGAAVGLRARARGRECRRPNAPARQRLRRSRASVPGAPA